MSLQAVSWASRVRAGSPALKLLLIFLADRADEHARVWYRPASLMESCEFGAEDLIRALFALTHAGLIGDCTDPYPGGDDTGLDAVRLLVGDLA